MSITALTIRNFRSIVHVSQRVSALNIFVGQNDEGKSNILRALDLFFNHDKEDGYKLSWNHDFCCFSPARVRKADEIVIEVEITPPSSFANATPVVWRKVWRREGLHLDSFKHRDGTEVNPKSKIASFLKSMRYDYVPAIKGAKYFQSLMSKLHDMLEATVEEDVRLASGAFTETINRNTARILEEIERRLSLETTIQLPKDLRDLFAQLEFTSTTEQKLFSLNQRGDGIKVRHIPIVLRWLAEQANHLSSPGRPKAVTVWGYEEPENNLEIRRCFDLAQEMLENSGDIQTFVTTHSPAFYSVFRDSPCPDVSMFLVSKNGGQSSALQPLTATDIDSVDSAMGLMRLLEPHFREARQEVASLRTSLARLNDTSRPTIFCEGPSDKKILKEGLRLFFPNNANQVVVSCSAANGGGHTWVGESMIAWSFSRPTAKAVGLFDQDKDAQRTRKQTLEKVNSPASGVMVRAVKLPPGDELKECFTRHIRIPFAIEELYPKDVWDFAEGKGWLEERPNLIGLYGFESCDLSFNDWIRSKLTDSHLLRMATQKVKLLNKEDLATHLCGLQPKSERERVLQAFKSVLQKCLEELGMI